jgi:hypothetical protein
MIQRKFIRHGWETVCTGQKELISCIHREEITEVCDKTHIMKYKVKIATNKDYPYNIVLLTMADMYFIII